MFRLRLTLVLLFAIIAGLVVAAQAADKKAPADQKITGTVSDAMCGRKHMMQGSAADCTRECAKASGYALVTDKDVFKLKGKDAELDKLAGEKATVTGKVSGDTIQVSSVAAAK